MKNKIKKLALIKKNRIGEYYFDLELFLVLVLFFLTGSSLVLLVVLFKTVKTVY